MPVNKFTSFATNTNRRISCSEISKSKNIKNGASHVVGYNKGNLWKSPIGILYNFALGHDQRERYYLDRVQGICICSVVVAFFLFLLGSAASRRLFCDILSKAVMLA